MIANCPSCGTSYKHDAPKTRVRARCGRCDAELELARQSSYRIVTTVGVTAVAMNASARPAHTAAAAARRPHDLWQDEDPLPQIPEMAVAGDAVSLHEGAAPDAVGASSTDGRSATFALWLAAGAIAGTGVSWTMGGETVTGLAVGAALGAIAGWGWLRWMSSK